MPIVFRDAAAYLRKSWPTVLGLVFGDKLPIWAGRCG